MLTIISVFAIWLPLRGQDCRHPGIRGDVWICEWEQYLLDTSLRGTAVRDERLWSILCDLLYDCELWVLDWCSNSGGNHRAIAEASIGV